MVLDIWDWVVSRRRRARRLAQSLRRFPGLSDLTRDGLSSCRRSLGHRARRGLSWSRRLAEALVLASEAARRVDGVPLDERSLEVAALVASGTIVEWGPESEHRKAAWPAAFVHSLAQRGSHVLAISPREATPLAEWLGACAAEVGGKVGLLQGQDAASIQEAALRCDITCGPAFEFGFAFLRDRMGRYASGLDPGKRNPNPPATWGDPAFAVAFDADRLLIDEARTPLIISPAPGEGARVTMLLHRWAAAYAGRFTLDDDYLDDARAAKIGLTESGCALTRRLPSPEGLGQVPLWQRYEAIETALAARRRYARDRDYVVRAGRVLLVDPATGEATDTRKFQGSLHEALEAREGLEVSVRPGAASQITRGELARLYPLLGGLSLTAVESRDEFRDLYRAPVAVVRGLGPETRHIPRRAFLDWGSCRDAVAAEAVATRSEGRAALIAAPSAAHVADLSRRLHAAGVAPARLDRSRPDADATLACSGHAGAVTVGKATDWLGGRVVPDAACAAAGGPHATAVGLADAPRHERRIAALAAGGTFQAVLSLDDAWIVRNFPDATWRLRAYLERTGRVPEAFLDRLLRRLERRRSGERRRLRVYEEQRRTMLADLGSDQHFLWPV